MSVYWRGDNARKQGAWWYRFRWSWKENGEQRTTEIRYSGRGANKTETKGLEESHREALRRGEIHPLEPWPKVEPPKPKVPLFVEYATLVWQNIAPRLKPRTLAFYQECAERVSRFEPIASLPMSEITKSTVDGYAAWRLGQQNGNSAHAINGELRTLRRVLRYAVESGVIDRCPVIHCLPTEGRNRVITLDEQKAYLKAATGDLRDAVIILVDTGLRPDSELFSLKWEDVNERRIRVRRGKTESAARVVPMTRRVFGVFERRRRKANGSAYVFPGHGATGHLMTLRKPHYRAFRTAKVKPFPLYSFRHTFGTRCAEGGLDRFALAYLMGHSSPNITARYYIHVGEPHVESAFQRFIGGPSATLAPASTA